MSPSRHRNSRGQGLVEFALVSLLVLVIVLGIMDFGYLFSGRISATNAVRTAARFGAVHSSAWTNASNPSNAYIEGQLKLTAVPAVIINDDAHIQINYLIPNLTTGNPCGHYSAASNAFVPTGSFTQATCVIPGNLIQVKATYVYTFITPMLSQTAGTVTILTQAVELIEN